MTRYSVFLSYSQLDSALITALMEYFDREMGVRYSTKPETFPASPPLRTARPFGSASEWYVLGKPAYRDKDSPGLAEMPSGASHAVGNLSACGGRLFIVMSARRSVLDGSHRRVPDILVNASRDEPAQRALAPAVVEEQLSAALSRVKAHFLSAFARGGHGKEARAAYAAARRAAIANSVLHEAGKWSGRAHLQSHRLAAAMAATGAPASSAAVTDRLRHVCMSALCDLASAGPILPAGRDRFDGSMKHLSVLPDERYAVLYRWGVGGSTPSTSGILLHGQSGAGKSALFHHAAAVACRGRIENVPVRMGRQFGGVDMRVQVSGGLLPAVWQPDFSGPARRSFEAAVQPVPATAASIPGTVAADRARVLPGILCIDDTARAACGCIEMLREPDGRLADKDRAIGSLVNNTDRSEGLTAGNGSEFLLYGNPGSWLIGGAGDDTFACWNGPGSTLDFNAMHDSFSLSCAWEISLAGTNATASLWNTDNALTRSADAGLTVWKSDAATRSRREGPLIDWDAAAARRKSDVVSCEITDLFEDDTTACIFPRRARDLFYGREIPPGDKPVGHAAAEREAGIINFAPRKSNKKTPGDISDVAAAR